MDVPIYVFTNQKSIVEIGIDDCCKENQRSKLKIHTKKV